MPKGASFERQICKQLSLWWTEGKRDDVFWRTSQSGGRATTRAKKGWKTHGSYGDITAVDPIGAPLMELFTIELKRGRSHGSPDDLVDALPTQAQRPFERCLLQAIDAHKRAESRTWLLILRRDRRLAVAYTEPRVLHALGSVLEGCCVRYDLRINRTSGRALRLRFVGVLLSDLLQQIQPDRIKKMSS